MDIFALFCEEGKCLSSYFQRNLYSSTFLDAVTNDSKNVCGLNICFSLMASSVHLGRLGKYILFYMNN